MIVAGLVDVDPWLVLAAEVDDLFGHRMSTDPAFRQTLVRNVARGSAFVVRDGGPGSPLLGAMLWRPGRNEIGWLAVAADGAEVWVDTFGPSIVDGTPAILLYRSRGFVSAGVPEGLPSGWDRIRMVRPVCTDTKECS